MSSALPAPPILSPPPLYEPNNNLSRQFQNNDAEPPAYTVGSIRSSGRAIRSKTSSLDLTEHVERSSRGERPTNERKEFTSNLVKGKEKEGKSPWAFLTVMGDANLSLLKGLPTVVEGEQVEGELKVDLDGSETFQAIIITVRGQIIGGAQNSDILTFLELSKVLWSSSSSPDPLSSTSKAANLLPGSKQKLEKLVPGSHSWPFSIDLPKEVALSVGPKEAPRVEVFRLPHTFFERHARARVHYEVIARFVRGFLKADRRLSTQFSYITITIPSSPSPLRVLAYQENTSLLGPEADPEGWTTLDPVKIRGATEWNREVEAKYIFSVASPLAYARGSIIPLSLVIKCKDRRTLELLSSPKSIIVRLRRCLRYSSDDRRLPESYPWTDEFEHSELAIWWPDSLVHPRARATSNNLIRLDTNYAGQDSLRDSVHNTNSRQSSGSRERSNGMQSNSDSRSRSRARNVEGETERREDNSSERRMKVLKGEIHLQNDLKPSTDMTRFRVEYSVVLFPPDIIGFQFDPSSSSSLQKGDILLAQPVEITTAFATGPRPRMYAPPQYESSFPGTTLVGDRISGLFQ